MKRGEVCCTWHQSLLIVGIVCIEAVQCFMPANGELVTVSTAVTVPVDVSLSLLKRTMTDTGESLDHFNFSCKLCELLHMYFS